MNSIKKFRKRWFETSITTNPDVTYGDTDSLYFYLLLGDIYDKYANIEEALDRADELGKKINDVFMDGFEKLVKSVNGNEKYNRMNFDHEVSGSVGFFVTKKHYAIMKNNMKGKRDLTFTNPDSFKVMGSPAIKSDASQIAKDMLEEMYETIMLKKKVVLSKQQMKNVIYMSIRNKYVKKTNDFIDTFNISEFGQVKKFPFNADLKTVPKHLLGMKWFNTFVHDQIRRGDACYMLDVRFDLGILSHKVKQINLKHKQDLIFGFTEKDILPTRLSQVAIPVDFTDYNTIQKTLKKHRIEIDREQIIEFHIDKKLNLYRCLFE